MIYPMIYSPNLDRPIPVLAMLVLEAPAPLFACNTSYPNGSLSRAGRKNWCICIAEPSASCYKSHICGRRPHGFDPISSAQGNHFYTSWSVSNHTSTKLCIDIALNLIFPVYFGRLHSGVPRASSGWQTERRRFLWISTVVYITHSLYCNALIQKSNKIDVYLTFQCP
jgi:hypothetical protein